MLLYRKIDVPDTDAEWYLPPSPADTPDSRGLRIARSIEQDWSARMPEWRTWQNACALLMHYNASPQAKTRLGALMRELYPTKVEQNWPRFIELAFEAATGASPADRAISYAAFLLGARAVLKEECLGDLPPEVIASADRILSGRE